LHNRSLLCAKAEIDHKAITPAFVTNSKKTASGYSHSLIDVDLEQEYNLFLPDEVEAFHLRRTRRLSTNHPARCLSETTAERSRRDLPWVESSFGVEPRLVKVDIRQPGSSGYEVFPSGGELI